jgi:hypothetical protein
MIEILSEDGKKEYPKSVNEAQDQRKEYLFKASVT